MVLVWLILGMTSLVGWLVSLFPVADTAPLQAALSPIGRLVAWVNLLNVGLPVAELLAAFGVYFGVVLALQGVMLVRRTFSMFWPGAGS